MAVHCARGGIVSSSVPMGAPRLDHRHHDELCGHCPAVMARLDPAIRFPAVMADLGPATVNFGHSKAAGAIVWSPQHQWTFLAIYQARARPGEPARLRGDRRRCETRRTGYSSTATKQQSNDRTEGQGTKLKLPKRRVISRSAGGLEVRAGIEPAFADLQSDASPLCHRTPEASLGAKNRRNLPVAAPRDPISDFSPLI
jgi:hypothetical protein